MGKLRLRERRCCPQVSQPVRSRDSDPGLSERAQPGLPLGSLASLQAGRTLPGTRSPRRRAGGWCAWRGGAAHRVPGWTGGGPGLWTAGPG